LSFATTALLGAITGCTILIGLPVAKMRNVGAGFKGFLNAMANGILIFLLWDVLSRANEPIQAAIDNMRRGRPSDLLPLVLVFACGIIVGLMSLVYFNSRVGVRIGPGAAVATGAARAVPSGRSLALMIAIGLGLHNFSEGLAIGQSAATGAISFAAVLIIGFSLHNITEGFGIAAPMASDERAPTWTFLLVAGLIGGGPTTLGTVIGYSFTSPYLFVLFLTLAAGALIYVIGEMFSVGRRMSRPGMVAWGVLIGFLAGYLTDLFLTYLGS